MKAATFLNYLAAMLKRIGQGTKIVHSPLLELNLMAMTRNKVQYLSKARSEQFTYFFEAPISFLDQVREGLAVSLRKSTVKTAIARM